MTASALLPLDTSRDRNNFGNLNALLIDLTHSSNKEFLPTSAPLVDGTIFTSVVVTALGRVYRPILCSQPKVSMPYQTQCLIPNPIIAPPPPTPTVLVCVQRQSRFQTETFP